MKLFSLNFVILILQAFSSNFPMILAKKDYFPKYIKKPIEIFNIFYILILVQILFSLK